MVYRTAIIGCGAIGGGYDRDPGGSWSFTHAGAYRLCRQTRVVAAADTNTRALARFGRKWQIPEIYTDYRELLERERPDIVSLCLPTPLHWKVFRKICAYPVKAIFCEKPLSADLRQARDMARLAEGRLVAVNYVRRWNPSLIRLRRDLAAGRFGQPLQVLVRYTKGLFGVGSHFVDFVRWFWGEPSEIVQLRRVERPDGDPGVDFRLRFAGGPDAYFVHVENAPYVFLDVDILTDRGRIVISQRGQTIEHFRSALDPHFQQFRILRRISEEETEWRVCLTSAVRQLVQCLGNGAQPACTAYDGLRAVEICRKAAGAR